MDREKADKMYGRWDDAVERSKDWAVDEGGD
jgi:glycerol kinase